MGRLSVSFFWVPGGDYRVWIRRVVQLYPDAADHDGTPARYDGQAKATRCAPKFRAKMHWRRQPHSRILPLDIQKETIRFFAELDHETSHAEWLVPDSVPTTEAEPSQLSRFTAQRSKAKTPDAVRDKGVNFLLLLAALFRVVIKVS